MLDARGGDLLAPLQAPGKQASHHAKAHTQHGEKGERPWIQGCAHGQGHLELLENIGIAPATIFAFVV